MRFSAGILASPLAACLSDVRAEEAEDDEDEDGFSLMVFPQKERVDGVVLLWALVPLCEGEEAGVLRDAPHARSLLSASAARSRAPPAGRAPIGSTLTQSCSSLILWARQ